METPIEIIYARPEFIPSFHQTLSRVASEKIYIEMIESPPLEKVREFQLAFIRTNAPAYYAVQGELVVGWCDISTLSNPRLAHRGNLGMGLLPEFRGRGLGGQLLRAALRQARQIGLDKVELTVYTSNVAAINLYRKEGFQQEGRIECYRKYEGRFYDCLLMAKFLR